MNVDEARRLFNEYTPNFVRVTSTNRLQFWVNLNHVRSIHRLDSTRTSLLLINGDILYAAETPEQILQRRK